MSLTLDSLELTPTSVSAVDEACGRIPPLWPLQNFVAVNPFLGLASTPFPEAAQLLGKVAHAAPLMDEEYYLARLHDGTISARDVAAAIAHARIPAWPFDPLTWLAGELRQPRQTEITLTVADSLDAACGTSWAPFLTDEISKWCSSYFDRGQSSWALPWKHLPLYQAWKRAARLDANPEVAGLPAFRRHVAQLPDSPEEAIEHALNLLEVPHTQTVNFLHRQLISIIGWSAYAAYQDRQASGEQHLRQLLAIRLAYDTALLSLHPEWQTHASRPASFTPAKYVAQLAIEHAFRSRLSAQLVRHVPQPAPATRKALQAVFCIDVRSEIYRRALESQSAEIETIGFAGFFGMAVDFQSTSRCPVLLQPKHKVHGDAAHSRPSTLARVWKSLQTSASACFPAVELAGAAAALPLLRQVNPHSNPLPPAESLTWHVPIPDQIDLAAGALKNMSLNPARLAPIVLLCGHGASTRNNPYASSLDCGACGGHKGDINARFAAAILNHPDVRTGLRARGIEIPTDTVFLPGLHITTTDEVILFDAECLLSNTQRAAVDEWLTAASRLARAERSRSLPLPLPPSSPEELDRELQHRSADWSEVRPEWGLAGNAAFVAAPRSRTSHLRLDGRVFLHEYDPAADHDASVLQLILTAPVVVASWINLQYFASTVNNPLYGSGNKVLHNVVGTFGVWEGNAGDLRTGLPLQSLHDGTRWVHEPLRLQVFVNAPRERIDKVLRANPAVCQLVDNEWIQLLAIEESSIYLCRGIAAWQLTESESA